MATTEQMAVLQGSPLNERRFRDVGKCSGDEGTWSELSLRALEFACESEIEGTKAHEESISTHLPPVEENGLEAWRSLRKRHDPKTTLRNLHLWLKIVNPER